MLKISLLISVILFATSFLVKDKFIYVYAPAISLLLFSCCIYLLERVEGYWQDTVKHRDKEVDLDLVTLDRDLLLIFMSRSFKKAGKLVIEKNHPKSNRIKLVFQLKNGNLRFSMDEDIFPETLLTGKIVISDTKVNNKSNNKLIKELLDEEAS